MTVNLEDVKLLRETTGASMMACKKALEETGDYEKAIEYLRKKGEAKAAEKSDRATAQGVIHSYIHTNRKVGAMVQLACETDFVAKNEKFIDLAYEIAMHIVAARPLTISPDEINSDLIAKEKEIWAEQLKNEGKAADKIEMILVGKEKKFREEMALLEQPFIKDPEKKVSQIISENVIKLGENIKIVRFARFEM